MQRLCKICLLPDSKFDINLSKDNICNRCKHWEATSKTYHNPSSHWQLFYDRIYSTKGKYPYDAMVGVSGGKDSSFVLYKLVTEYELNVLAITFNNGFLSEHGKNNIEHITQNLNVEHIYIQPPWDMHKSFYLAALRNFGDPCIGCPFPGTFLMTKICQERQIPYFIHGRSPHQMFRNFTPDSNDISIPMIEAGITKHSFKLAHDLNIRLDKMARSWLLLLFPDASIRSRVYETFFLDPKNMTENFAPEQVAYFLYHNYDEEDMKQVLENELGFVRHTKDGLLSHHDCEIHNASSYIFRKIHAVNQISLETATMLRRKELSKKEALRILEREEKSTFYPKESIDCLCNKLGISNKQLEAIIDYLRTNLRSKFDCH